MNTHIRNFLLILVAGLLSSVVGGLFGVVIAMLSPEFASQMFGPQTAGLTRFAAAVGAVWGLFIGAGAMAFVLCVAAAAKWFRPREKPEEK